MLKFFHQTSPCHHLFFVDDDGSLAHHDILFIFYSPFVFVFQQAFLGGLVLLSELLPIPLPIRSLEVCEYFKTLPSLELLSETLRYFLGYYENVADFNLH